jgi:AbrB family looped-hinge helix DNA binding protein
VDQNGRVLIPAPVRRALGLRDGSELLVTLDDGGRVVLVTPHSAWARVQELAGTAFTGTSVVDELLAERRADARREDPDGSVDNLLGA